MLIGDGSMTVVCSRVTWQVNRSALERRVNVTLPSGLTTCTSRIGTTLWERRDDNASGPGRGTDAVGCGGAWHAGERHKAAVNPRPPARILDLVCTALTGNADSNVSVA